ncbi:MAG: class I SAM-dependent methyltransferase [Chloroflexota bacterium]
MTALEQWQQQIRACRQARKEPDAQLWQRAAGWYDSWVRHNDYTTLVLNRLQPIIDGRSRILEIGPGSGGFTLPLADAAQEIVAVEPSADMRAVLGGKLSAAGKNNVRLIPKHIEDSLAEIQGPFDLALASFSLYNVEPIDAVVQGLTRLARRVVALMGSGEQREWYRHLHRRFRGREPVPPPQVQYFYPLLLEMGIYPDVQVFWTSYNYVYPSEEALIDWWLHHLHLSESDRADLAADLLPLTERRDGQIGIYGRHRAALVWIERGRNAGND